MEIIKSKVMFWAAGTNSSITIGNEGKKTTISGNVMAGGAAVTKIILGTADSQITEKWTKNTNNISTTNGTLEIRGVQGASVSTDFMQAIGGGSLTVTGTGMNVTVETTAVAADGKGASAVDVAQSSTATLGTAEGRLASLTVKGVGSGLLAENDVGNVGLSKGPDIYVAADTVAVSASKGIGIWAAIDNVSAGADIKAPNINIDANRAKERSVIISTTIFALSPYIISGRVSALSS